LKTVEIRNPEAPRTAQKMARPGSVRHGQDIDQLAQGVTGAYVQAANMESPPGIQQSLDPQAGMVQKRWFTTAARC
jgi:hypothetical protein